MCLNRPPRDWQNAHLFIWSWLLLVYKCINMSIYFTDAWQKWFNILDLFRALQKWPLFCILTWIIRMSFEFINRIERMVKFLCAHSQELHKLDFLLECCSTNFIKGLSLLQFTGGSGDVWKWKWICKKWKWRCAHCSALISHLTFNG